MKLKFFENEVYYECGKNVWCSVRYRPTSVPSVSGDEELYIDYRIIYLRRKGNRKIRVQVDGGEIFTSWEKLPTFMRNLTDDISSFVEQKIGEWKTIRVEKSWKTFIVHVETINGEKIVLEF